MKEDWHGFTQAANASMTGLLERITSAAVPGNTYKDLMEATTLSSGLSFVLLANLLTAVAGLLLYYFLLGRLNTLSDHDVSLLARFPSLQHHRTNHYSPVDQQTSRAPPPFRWTGWLDFHRGPHLVAAQKRRIKQAQHGFASTPPQIHTRSPLYHPHATLPAFAERLSRDAQVYLLFLRLCILLTLLCGAVAMAILAPVYLTGFQHPKKLTAAASPLPLPTAADTPASALALTQGAFNRLTSQNIPRQSPLLLLQLPVWAVVVSSVLLLHSAMSTVNAKESRYDEWLRRPIRQEGMGIFPLINRMEKQQFPSWTVFARGIPDAIKSNDQFTALLEAVFPNQLVRAELLYQGLLKHCTIQSRVQEKRRQLEYLDTLGVSNRVHLRKRSCCFCIPVPTPTKQELVHRLEASISEAEKKMAHTRTLVQTGFLNCAFITFKSSNPAEACIRQFPYQKRPEHQRSDPPNGSLVLQNVLRFFSRLIPFVESSNWRSEHCSPSQDYSESELACQLLGPMRAEIAPKAGDVVWAKIGMSLSERILRDIIVAFIVFVLLILFTSPVAMITGLRQMMTEAGALASSIGPDGFGWGDAGNSSFPDPLGSGRGQDPDVAALSVSETLISFLPDFVVKRSFARSFLLLYTPVLLLGLINSFVPSILRSACVFEGYATRSERELSIFTKTVFYFVMNTIVLPSLALNTARELAEILYVQSGGGDNVNRALPIVERFFSSDVTYFLCCYLVQLALTVNILMLLRIPSVFASWSRRWFAVTPLALAQAKCSGSFDFACHYAYCIMVLCMCLMFGVTAPAMWVFAAVYFTVKFYVDSFNLHYVHARSHNDGRLARRVADVTFFACVVCACGYSVVFYLREFDFAAAVLVTMAAMALMGSSSISCTVGPWVLRWTCLLSGLENISRSTDSPFYDFVDQEQEIMETSAPFGAKVSETVRRQDSGVIVPKSPPNFHLAHRKETDCSEISATDAGSSRIVRDEYDTSRHVHTEGPPENCLPLTKGLPNSRCYGSIGLP